MSGSVELILERLAEKRMVLVILKANEGYSAVPMSGELYKQAVLMEHHHNGPTVLNAAHQALMAVEEGACMNL